jgi:aryl-alcohol dehydrogenase-like predicted oxidoreductase
VEISSVQNLYNVTNRQSEALVDACSAAGIGFIPWFPVAAGELTGPGSAVAEVASELGATPAQVSIAWLLHRSDVVLPIPGTSSVAHLEENCASASLSLSVAQLSVLDGLAAP